MKKVVDTMQRIQIAIGGIFLTIFLFAVVTQMICRYLGIAAMWTEEVSMYSFIWAVFMGAAAMVHADKHFAFTSVSDMIKSPKAKRVLHMVISIIMLVFAILMCYYGVIVTKQFWNYKWINIPQLNRGPTWACLPLCGLTSSIYLIQHILEDISFLGKGGEK
ncbi:MAG: TRAP transporter small permease [Lachnospiraceae bacterium]|nr:TRAP transporter small permease [Lachnospiraceae bacterium]